METEHIIMAVEAASSLFEYIRNERTMLSVKKRVKSLETQLRSIQNHLGVIDPQYASSEEFISLALRIVWAALRDHREFKHRVLAYALTSSASDKVSWQYEKKQLLIDITDQLEPYHFVILDRCQNDTDWSAFMDIPDIPEPHQHLLVNAIQRLVNESLLRSIAQPQTISFPTRADKSWFKFQTPELKEILESSTFCITELGKDLLDFVSFPFQEE